MSGVLNAVRAAAATTTAHTAEAARVKKQELMSSLVGPTLRKTNKCLAAWFGEGFATTFESFAHHKGSCPGDDFRTEFYDYMRATGPLQINGAAVVVGRRTAYVRVIGEPRDRYATQLWAPDNLELEVTVFVTGVGFRRRHVAAARTPADLVRLLEKGR
jgi:hypothetical protein